MSGQIKVAIVDDSQEDAQHLVSYLEQFQKEERISIDMSVYYASFDFLEEYDGKYDVIFLDIEMPGSDGLEVAREIRARDENVGIVFVTSMAQYAIAGYEVNAIDFMVKPVGYYNFATKLKKAFQFYQRRSVRHILLSNKDGIRKVATSDILYMEKERDNLIFHTETETFKERSSMKAMKEKLGDLPFAECTAGCLVNLQYVTMVGKDSIWVKDQVELPLSRRNKKQFCQEYISYVGVEG